MGDLATLIAPGAGIWWGQGGAEPSLTLARLVEGGHLTDQSAFVGASFDRALFAALPDTVRLSSYGALNELRGRARAGALDIIPSHYSQLPALFASGRLPTDVGIVQVSPPDAEGFVSMGVGVDYMADAITHTRVMIAEINENAPRTAGGPRLPLSAFAAVVESDAPLNECPNREPDAVDRAVAANVASLIEDGSTVQIGVGALPNAVLEALSDHRELGVHSGIITDAVLGLVDRGVVTGSLKGVDAGVVVAGSVFGSRAGYAALPDHPVVLRPTTYTHSAAVLARVGSLVSVNSAIEVDLSGQVGAEVAGRSYLGAVGGQIDFSRAASTNGGRAVIALRSFVASSDGGSRSTIVPRLAGPVSTPRSDVDFVVTEHGIAEMTGASMRERAERLIAVADPGHREALGEALRDRGY